MATKKQKAKKQQELIYPEEKWACSVNLPEREPPKIFLTCGDCDAGDCFPASIEEVLALGWVNIVEQDEHEKADAFGFSHVGTCPYCAQLGV